jgi:F-type H+-transporting ATPase subunit gamma
MGGQLKDIRSRIKSVQGTQQITKAMKMVSAAKLRRASDRIMRMRPYAEKLNEMLSNIASGSDSSISLAKGRPIKKVLLVVVTSDRGLAGGFNTNLVKLGRQTITDKYHEQFSKGNVTIMPIGRKALESLRKGYPVKTDYSTLMTNVNYDDAAKAADWLMNSFLNGDYDVIDIIYSQFKNAVIQVYTVERFLPVQKSPGGKTASRPNFIFEPDEEELVKKLVPKILKTQFFKVLLDTNASEHGARMTAMDTATENADEMIKDLRLIYNRARQAAITTELNEIVGGADALKGS